MDHGAIWSQPYDAMMGAGTFHPHTFLRGIGPEPWRAVYLQPCRRPVDGRYGKSAYRFQHYYQLQVLLKPSPANIVDLFLSSLQHVGISLAENDVSLLEDDWKGPTLGAWGLGWEIRANGQEVTQFTYFQQLGGMDIEVVSGEITYGLERLYMYAKGLDNALEMPYNDNFTYGDIFYQNEFEFSRFNFKEANTAELFAQFDTCERNVHELCGKNLILPAYDYVLQASHTFNLLDARGAISVSERQRYIGRVRDCARECAGIYRAEREKLGFPMMKRLDADPRQILQPLSLQRTAPGVGSGAREVTEAAQDAKPYAPAQLAGRTTTDVLFELGVEEMPPSFQKTAQEDLQAKVKGFVESLKGSFPQENAFIAILEKAAPKVFVTSRRIALEMRGVPAFEPDRTVAIWGPAERIARKPDGGLSPAGEGFLRKNGLASAEASFRVKDGSMFLFAEKHVKGRDLPTVLAENVKAWIEGLGAPLMMRWLPEAVSKPFIRPVRWIVALADDACIPLEMFGLLSSRVTTGQRILSPEPIRLKSAREYEVALTEKGVKLDWAARRASIALEGAVLTAKVGGRLREDEGLLDKVVGLSESPFVFLGSFDAKYLRLPKALVASVLREHMNYFTVESDTGELLPHYVGVAGYRCGDVVSMAAGTRNVVVGRLEDGAFYYDGDLETPVGELRERLRNQLFQAEMGTLWDKTVRVGALAATLAEQVAKAPGYEAMPHAADALSKDEFVKAARLAGEFSKADLRSGCVQEFPDEMQGVMGGVLVRHQTPFGALSDEISRAVGDHYEPKSAQAPLPGTVLGHVVALADKLDSLCLMMNQGEELKGNKDPFGLRRLAIGVLRLLGMEEGDATLVPLTLETCITLALDSLKAEGRAVVPDSYDRIRAFLLGRLKAAWRAQYNPGAVDAATTMTRGMTLARARRLVATTEAALRVTGEGSLQEALVPYRRCRNLTADLPATEASSLEVKETAFAHEVEKALFTRLKASEAKVGGLLAADDFEGYFAELAALGKPLAAFFDGVMVLDKDEAKRDNRLALLVRIRRLYESVADFSAVQV